MATTFNQVTDYFGLASASLVPISSSEGRNLSYATARNANDGDYGADTIPHISSETTRFFPETVYEVVGDMTLDITIGKGFFRESKGYMITGFTVDTSLGNPPRVTVRGEANEGASAGEAVDAVKTKDFSVPISFRHRAQILNSSFTTTYDILACSMSVSANAVTVEEDGVALASDVSDCTETVMVDIPRYGAALSFTKASGYTLLENPLGGEAKGYRSMKMKLVREVF